MDEFKRNVEGLLNFWLLAHICIIFLPTSCLLLNSFTLDDPQLYFRNENALAERAGEVGVIIYF